ncbi:MAG: hypothetical protein JXD21_07365 [Candidatus Omnitrophica bacterium]|nr:hypothetical protein [Candidatus Omnitrophota bacterium]
MKIIRDMLSIEELRKISGAMFGNMVKAVVDIERGIVALDAELHSDLEALLLDDGADQKNLWGINLYPDMPQEDFIEYDSMINMRPAQGNSSRSVENEQTRKKIVEIISQWIKT